MIYEFSFAFQEYVCSQPGIVPQKDSIMKILFTETVDFTKVIQRAETRELHEMIKELQSELKIREDDESKEPGLLPREIRLLASDSKIYCIKAYRSRIGCTLLEAKETVDEYEGNLHKDIPELSMEEERMLREGFRVDAIRAYRFRTGVTLKPAKDLAEAYLEEYHGPILTENR
jgi:ribosomal protein L7/L12